MIITCEHCGQRHNIRPLRYCIACKQPMKQAEPAAGEWCYDLSKAPQNERVLLLYDDDNGVHSCSGFYDRGFPCADQLGVDSTPIAFALVNIPEDDNA